MEKNESRFEISYVNNLQFGCMQGNSQVFDPACVLIPLVWEERDICDFQRRQYLPGNGRDHLFMIKMRIYIYLIQDRWPFCFYVLKDFLPTNDLFVYQNYRAVGSKWSMSNGSYSAVIVFFLLLNAL